MSVVVTMLTYSASGVKDMSGAGTGHLADAPGLFLSDGPFVAASWRSTRASLIQSLERGHAGRGHLGRAGARSEMFVIF